MGEGPPEKIFGQGERKRKKPDISTTSEKVAIVLFISAKIHQRAVMPLTFLILLGAAMSSCNRIASPDDEVERQPIARVENNYLYRDELTGISPPGAAAQDSAQRAESYIDSWIRKQLLIAEATRKMDINELEVERKILDYRYSIIAYEYQAYYVKQKLDTAVSFAEIEDYYKKNIDNFVLKQNIVQATFIKVAKTAPRTDKIKEMILSNRAKDDRELKSYCLSFSAAYHLSDSTWIVFDDLVRNSPLAEFPNKIQFLKANPYFETSDDSYLYFLKVDSYRITDNTSPLEFVRDEVKNVILNKRKVQLAKQLEDVVYEEAESNEKFEIYN
jgi:hypothetical protein